MTQATLVELFERNRRHVESLPEGHFEEVQEGQEPAVVSVCCSDSRVSQEGMWAIEEPGWLFTAGNIGNQVWDTHDGELVLGGDVLYPIRHAGTEVAVVVGHTGCGAVTAALEAVRADEPLEAPPGIEARIEPLRPVVEDGLEDDRLSGNRDVRLVDQLVEYNVDRQIEFFREDPAVPDSVTALGFVYDFQGIYGDVEGRCYLVNRDGETDLGRLSEAVSGEFRSHVSRLL